MSLDLGRRSAITACLALALILGACSGSDASTPPRSASPSPLPASTTSPAPTQERDPVDLVLNAIAAVHDLKTVQVDLEIDGAVSGDLLGIGSPGEISLDNMSVRGEMDIAAGSTHVWLDAPPLLGVSGEWISIGQDTWTRTSVGGVLWTHATRGQPPEGLTSKPWVEQLLEIEVVLRTEAVEEEWLGNEACGTSRCDRVRLNLNPALLASLGAMSSTAVSLTAWIREEDSLPVRFQLEAIEPQGGDGARELTLRVEGTLSRHNEPLEIPPPSADSIASPVVPTTTPTPATGDEWLTEYCDSHRRQVDAAVPLPLTRVERLVNGCRFVFAPEGRRRAGPDAPALVVWLELPNALAEVRASEPGQNLDSIGDEAYLTSDMLIATKYGMTWSVSLHNFPSGVNDAEVMRAAMRAVLPKP